MGQLREFIHKLINLRSEDVQMTLLAVCPNSDAVLESAVASAAKANAPMLFAATLNQVDRDGGYTGWTQKTFVERMEVYARQYHWKGPLFPCLDHGGPWLKDRHTTKSFSLQETMNEVKLSLTASLQAGYNLLHIDPTVDRTLPQGAVINISVVADRTAELIAHAEKERIRMGLPPVDYEAGTEEVHGGLADLGNFNSFLLLLRRKLKEKELIHAWPCFIVAKVGTDLHTTCFDPLIAEKLVEIVRKHGSLIKGHYTDWVDNPEDYPASGMGGGNVGPEFTAEEYKALLKLSQKESGLCLENSSLAPSAFLDTLQQAVVDSGRWKKWLQPGEIGLDFKDLSQKRREWLIQTGARYIWTDKNVLQARTRLYQNLKLIMPSPHQFVLDEIKHSIDRYLTAFNLVDSLSLLENGE